MGWFDRAINRGVKEGVEAAVKSFTAPGGGLEVIIGETVRRKIEELPVNAELTRAGFVYALAVRFLREGVPWREAMQYGWDTLTTYLADEKIAFGAADYSWDRSGADTIAEEYEIDHWERAA